MSNIFQDFIAARSAKKGKHTVANADAPVTRAEFNTLSLAVAGLIEDFEAVATPDKIAAVINEAMTEVVNGAKGGTTTVNARAHLAPSDSDEIVAPPRVARTATVANATATTRKPLALPADRSHLAPKGE